MVVLIEECRLLLTEFRRGKKPEDFLFTRKNGEVVKDFRGRWDDLTETAGVPGLLFHDFRRTSVRNMIRRGCRKRRRGQFRATRPMPCSRATTLCPRMTSGTPRGEARKAPRPQSRAQIHSSFIVAPNQGNEGVALKDRKPS